MKEAFHSGINATQRTNTNSKNYRGKGRVNLILLVPSLQPSFKLQKKECSACIGNQRVTLPSAPPQKSIFRQISYCVDDG